jgi:hypothetical protein
MSRNNRFSRMIEAVAELFLQEPVQGEAHTLKRGGRETEDSIPVLPGRKPLVVVVGIGEKRVVPSTGKA